MSGSSIGSVVGGAIGFVAAGPAGARWGIAIGGILGGILMPDRVGVQDQNGPRLTDTKVSSSTYGLGIPKIYGGYRIPINIIWALPLKETKHVEEEEVGKGGSETYQVVTYTYSATFAVGICEGEISGIKKIWANSVLLYDFGEGATLNELKASAQISNQFTIHKGTPDQEPDWLIQLYQPDTPAYRNTAYIVFNDLQLEKFGNRIPNITVEAIKSGDIIPSVYLIDYDKGSNYPDQIRDSLFNYAYNSVYQVGETVNDGVDEYTNGISGNIDYPNFKINSSYYNKDKDNYYHGYDDGKYATVVFDGVDQTDIDSEMVDNGLLLFFDDTLNTDEITRIERSALSYGESTLNGRSDDQNIVVYDINGFTPGAANGFAVIGNGEQSNYLLSWPGYVGPVLDYREVTVDYQLFGLDASYYDISDGMNYIYVDDILYIWRSTGNELGVYIPGLLDHKDGSYDQATTTVLINKTALNTSTLIDVYVSDSEIYCLVSDPLGNPNNPSIKRYDANGIFIDEIVLLPLLPPMGTIDITKKGLIQVQDDTIFLYFSDSLSSYFMTIENGILTLKGAVVNVVTPITSTVQINISDVITAGVGSYNFDINTFKFMDGLEEYVIYFDTIINTPVELSSIVTDLIASAGIDSSLVDATEGDSIYVHGYYLEKNMSPRAALASLQSVYRFDLIEIDFGFKLKMRGGPALKQLENIGAGTENYLEMTRTLETEMPSQVNIKYANSEIDYQNGLQSVTRIDATTRSIVTIDAPIAITDDYAKQLADKIMNNSWGEKESFILTIFFDKDLSPGDVVTVDYDGIQYRMRIIRLISATNYTMQLTCVNDYDYQSTAIGSNTGQGFQSGVANTEGKSHLYVFNAPTLDNAVLDNAGVYYAVSGDDTWPGCEVFKASTGSNSYSTIGAIYTNIPIGETYGVLGPATWALWDRDNTILVHVNNPAGLQSISTDLVLMGNNNAKLGNEIIQFADVTDNGNGTYTLSTLLRGRFGTEWAIDGHKNREPFILLTNDVGFNQETVTTDKDYKAVSFGTYLDDAAIKNEESTGENLMPFSPGRLQVNGSYIRWLGRSRRLNGYLKQIPDAEAQQKYKIEYYYLGVYQGFDEVVNVTDFQYNQTTYPNVDVIRVSQYSDNLSAYGYTAEVNT